MYSKVVSAVAKSEARVGGQEGVCRVCRTAGEDLVKSRGLSVGGDFRALHI